MTGEHVLLESVRRLGRMISSIRVAEWDRQSVLGYAETAAGLLLVAAGTALFPFPMVGLLGIPLVLVGFPLSIYGLFALSHTGRSHLMAHVSGAILIVAGVGVILAVSAYHAEAVHACFLAWERSLPIDLPSFSAVTVLPLIGPALLVSGIWLRRGERPPELAALWSVFLVVSVVTIWCAVVFAWFVPLSG